MTENLNFATTFNESFLRGIYGDPSLALILGYREKGQLDRQTQTTSTQNGLFILRRTPQNILSLVS
jgi:hypothetical protein